MAGRNGVRESAGDAPKRVEFGGTERSLRTASHPIALWAFVLPRNLLSERGQTGGGLRSALPEDFEDPCVFTTYERFANLAAMDRHNGSAVVARSSEVSAKG